MPLSNASRYRRNLYGVQGGSKLQGLPPSSGVNRRVVLRRACGNPEDRTKIYYGNSVGGVGMRIPNVQKYKCACTHPIYSKNPYLA